MHRRLVLSLSAIVVVLALLGAASVSVGAEQPTAPETPPTSRAVDNEGWGVILARYLTSGARFDYRALAARPDDREMLAGWLAEQARVSVGSLSRDARKAFWINLYNAATVELMVRHWPVESILKLGLIPGRAWKWSWIRADGRLLSLDEIEHEILRAEFGDPRIHFAINCASVSCPPLRREPYRAEDLDDRLDRAARDYLASPAGLGVRTEGGTVVVTVSKIFDWFREDFDQVRGGVIGFLETYAPPETGSLLRRNRGRVDVRYAAYDWDINAPAGSAGGTSSSGS